MRAFEIVFYIFLKPNNGILRFSRVPELTIKVFIY